jgi:hypothetical protein
VPKRLSLVAIVVGGLLLAVGSVGADELSDGAAAYKRGC